MSEPSRTMSRRRFGLSLSLIGSAGCGFGTDDPLRFLEVQTERVRIVTPWGEGLRNEFAKSFARWQASAGLVPSSIRWFEIRESELASASIENLLRFADVILGGHRTLHVSLNSAHIAHADTKPCRYPVFRTVRPSPSGSRLDSNPSNAIFDNGTESANDELPLALYGGPNDPVVDSYFLAIYDDAPDQAAGYARWIRTVGNSIERRNGGAGTFRELALAESFLNDRTIESVWAGGAGTRRALGIAETATVHWPEAVSWLNGSDGNGRRDRLVQFCRQAGWIGVESGGADQVPSRYAIRELMIGILRTNCRESLRTAWAVMLADDSPRMQDAERYLTTLPPWPPASIQKLRQERGFEFVVSLANQLAVDESQRNLLVDEFGKSNELTDFRMLENADKGRLSDSTRFLVWLRAEWTAWIEQRCRRAIRYLSNPTSTGLGNTDIHRSGVTSES